ncbi:MAG TPA: hypothetical protein VFE46_17755 [Pirellulales bacterium]|jgi:hypothetical protein|nr:hypothetical protein [Pirellulales bacterium]
MDKIVLDTAVAGQLAQAHAQVQLCDPSGHTLGYFVPAAEHDREAYAQAKLLWTDEEVEELSKQNGGITTEELLQRLSKL